MPAVDVAMERSLRGGFLDLLAASIRPALGRRDLQGQISDVRTAFSSWDNCMAVNYCKWPVIAVIIVGGLILISVVWCIIRCACCGLSCCCSCFSCLKCCGNCCGCCDPPRGSRAKYLDEPYIPPNHGYKSEAPMHSGFDAPSAKAPPAFPQYAEFETSKKNEDALPEMPSWEGAEKKKVYLEEEEGVEMNALKKPEAGAQTGAAAAIGGAAAAAAVPSNSSRSPVNRDPYGPPGANSNAYFAPGIADNDPYARGAPEYNQPGMAYNEPGQEYGMASAAMGQGRQSPHPYNNAGGYNGGYNDGGFGRGHDYPAQGSYDNYGAAARQQPYDGYDNYGAQANQGYATSQRQSPSEMDAAAPPYAHDARRSPAPQAQFAGAGAYGADPRRSPGPQGAYSPNNTRRSPAPQADYGSRPYPPRQYSSDSTQPLRAPPQRQYSAASSNHHDSAGRGPGSPGPLRNDAGFDFTSGYSRPPATTSPVHSIGAGYRQPSPAVEGQYGAEPTYPGYKPYQRTA